MYDYIIVGAALALFHSAVDWDYSTEEEPYLNNHKIYWPRGTLSIQSIPIKKIHVGDIDCIQDFW